MTLNNLTDEDITSFRKLILNKMSVIGRAPGAKAGGGNARKRFYLTIADFDQLTLSEVEDLLAS